jgi:hypothetical protein
MAEESPFRARMRRSPRLVEVFVDDLNGPFSGEAVSVGDASLFDWP